MCVSSFYYSSTTQLLLLLSSSTTNTSLYSTLLLILVYVHSCNTYIFCLSFQKINKNNDDDDDVRHLLTMTMTIDDEQQLTVVRPKDRKRLELLSQEVEEEVTATDVYTLIQDVYIYILYRVVLLDSDFS